MNRTEQMVNEVLESLDGVHRASANPYLYTRIIQRLHNRHETVYHGKLMPVLAVALCLFISLNVFSYFKTGNEAGPKETPVSSIENFAREYNLSEDGL